MLEQQALSTVEPIEAFLTLILCSDKLALYQRALNVIKTNQKTTVIDTLNSVVANGTNEAPSMLFTEIHNLFQKHIQDMLAEYDLIVERHSLPFMLDLLDYLYALDSFELHEPIVNICMESGQPKDRLFEILSLMGNIDEETYMQDVLMCSMSLLDRIQTIHENAIVKAEDTVPETAELDPSVLRKVVGNNRQLVISQLYESAAITGFTTVENLTHLAESKITEQLYQPKVLATELIGLYLASGQKPPELFETIKQQIPALCNNDNIITQTLAILGSVYGDLTHE